MLLIILNCYLIKIDYSAFKELMKWNALPDLFLPD
jgi:hypothetical protein